MNSKIENTEYNNIKKLYLNGLSSPKIAKQYNVNEITICKILKKCNVKPHGEKPRKYFFNFDFFEKIDTEEKAYFLGLMYSDGCNYKVKSLCSIALAEEDKDILDQFIKSIQYTGKCKLSRKKRKKHHSDLYGLFLHSKKTCLDLEKNGCMSRKSLILKFPKNDIVPSFLIKHFLRGFFDGDGSIHINKKEKRLTVYFTSSLFFCEDLIKFLKNKFNFESSLRHYSYSKAKSVRICGTRKNIFFLDWLYSNCEIKMQRKYKQFCNFCRFYLENNNNLNNSRGSNLDVSKIALKYF